MFIENAYERRTSLSDRDLERLLSALKDEAERYRYAIRNYPPDGLEKHGLPFLAAIEAKVTEIERLIQERTGRST
jgi:hypothetical protein